MEFRQAGWYGRNNFPCTGESMAGPLIAIVGDISSDRVLEPAMKNPAKAKKAAYDLGAELAQRGARLLVYGGPFLEADIVRGFVAGKPAEDRSILTWYSKENEPIPFEEESADPNLFERRLEKGADWWETLSAGEDLPNREEIGLMARPWADGAAAECVKALFSQLDR
jgi:hypothetical protein